MTDETTDPTEILSRPDPTESIPTEPDPAEPGPFVAGPPPPPPGQDPSIPVRDAPPRPPGPARSRWWSDPEALKAEPVGVLAAAAILVAYAATWLDAVLLAVRHQPGIDAQQRVLELFGPGSIEWGVIVLVGLGLLAAARRDSAPGRAVATGLLVAAAGVLGAAGLGMIVELANFGHGIDAAFTGIVGRVGAAAVAGAGLWWAWKARSGPRP